jgi:hypothetical protein
MTNENLPDGFHAKPHSDGRVEFRFVVSGSEVLSGFLTAEQLSIVVANLLNSANGAFHIADKKLPSAPQIFQREAIQVSRWGIGEINPQSQAVIIEVGEATIAFGVPPDKLRELARYLIVASHQPRSALPLRNFLREMCYDLAAGLRGFF